MGLVPASAEKPIERRYALRARGVDLASIASRLSEVLGVPIYSLARKLAISTTSVTESATRGAGIAQAGGGPFTGNLKT